MIDLPSMVVEAETLFHYLKRIYYYNLQLYQQIKGKLYVLCYPLGPRKILVLRMGTPTEWNLPIGQPNSAPFLSTSKIRAYSDTSLIAIVLPEV